MKIRPFSTRALLLLILLVGLPLGILRERQTRFRRIAAEHDRAAGPASDRGTIYFFDPDTGRDRTADEIRRIAERVWHDIMARKYRDGARQPWFPVLADRPCEDFIDEILHKGGLSGRR